MTLTSSILGVPCLALANLNTGGRGGAILSTLYHDRMGRLFGIVTANAAGAHLSRHGYTLDKAGRRTRATRENGQRWDYGYDDVGQVTSGVKKFPNGDPIPGHSFAFEYDGIGNRTAATHGGANTAVTYTPNALNQYDPIETEGGRFILGEAPPANSVIINGDTQNPAARPGGLGFYWKQITADNSSGPLWSTDTVESGGITITGQAWTPAASVAPEYDFDGNLTNDGRWDYLWDAEHTRRLVGWADCAEHSPARGDSAVLGQNHQNRLIRMTTTFAAANAGVPRQRLDSVYDSQGRRVSKTVSTSPDGNTWTVAANRRFLYDGWNLIAEYSPLQTGNLKLETSFVWGLDLSGTMQGAGGVGGLLAVHIHDPQSSIYYPAYDGNGNISAWISEVGTLLARMDYSPFGQLIAHYKFTTDAILSRLPFGFSTKYTDPETGLLYYGHRYYDPVHGRWQSRDPIGERGGVNLYGFVGNDGVGMWDVLGMIGTAELDSLGLIQMRATMWVRFVCCEKKTAEEKMEWRRKFKQNVENIYNYFYGIRLELTVIDAPDWNNAGIAPAPDIADFELTDEEIADRLRINLVTVDCRIGKNDDAYGGSGVLNNRMLLGWDHGARTQAHEVLHIFGLDDEGMRGVGRTPYPIQPLRNNQINHFPDTDFITTTVIRPNDIRDILNKHWEDSETGGKPHPKINGDGPPSERWVRNVRMRSELKRRIHEHEKVHGRISQEDKSRIIRDVIKEFESAQ